MPTEIFIGQNILGNISHSIDLSPYSQIVVISDQQLASAVGAELVQRVDSTGKPIHSFAIEALESNKTESEHPLITTNPNEILSRG